jgi:hypothetical protein
MKRELKIRRLDLAKPLLEDGVCPPAGCFPLIVEEAGAARHPVDRQPI